MRTFEGYTIAIIGNSVLSSDDTVEDFVCGCDTINEVYKYVPDYDPANHMHTNKCGEYVVYKGKQDFESFHDFE